MLSPELETITKIIEAFGKSGADELEIADGTLKIRLRRFAERTISPVAAAADVVPDEPVAVTGNSSRSSPSAARCRSDNSSASWKR